jgi:hypothetical protein
MASSRGRGKARSIMRFTFPAPLYLRKSAFICGSPSLLGVSAASGEISVLHTCPFSAGMADFPERHGMLGSAIENHGGLNSQYMDVPVEMVRDYGLQMFHVSDGNVYDQVEVSGNQKYAANLEYAGRFLDEFVDFLGFELRQLNEQ